MEAIRQPWFVERDPGRIRFTFFISHVSEDADTVIDLRSQIAGVSARGGRTALDCFLDVHAWQIANDSREVIKEFLPKSEYLVVWITPAYLRTRRGWVWMELAYAELIELSLNYQSLGLPYPYIIPVFQGVSLAQVARTPLLSYWQRSLLYPPGKALPVPEIARKLVDFHDQEALKRSHAPPRPEP
jgi:hypothetical protein